MSGEEDMMLAAILVDIWHGQAFYLVMYHKVYYLEAAVEKGLKAKRL